MKEIICEECGNKMEKTPNGLYVCYHCREITKIINAIELATDKVADRLDVIIKRSQIGNL